MPRLRAAIIGTLSVLLMFGAGQGAAAPPDLALDTVEVVGSTDLYLAPSSGSVDICYHGDVSTLATRMTGSWRLAVTGTPLLTPLILNYSGYVVTACKTVSKAGQAAGQLAVVWSYVGVGGYTLAGSVGGATWSPVTGDLPYAVDINQDP